MGNQVQLLLSASAIKVFRLRGVTPDILLHRIGHITRIFGADFTEKQLSKPIEDTSKASLVCERGALVAELSKIRGINDVVKEITAYREPNLLQPEGQWFQLVLGGMLNRLGADIEFEQTIGESAPKDILIQNRKCHVECKSFLRSAALEMIWRHHMELFDKIKTILPNGQWRLQLEYDWSDRNKRDAVVDQILKNATTLATTGILKAEEFELTPSEHQSELTGEWPEDGFMSIIGTSEPSPSSLKPFSMTTGVLSSLLIEGPHLDEFKRVYDVLSTKRRQMIDGWVNIIALDASELTGNIDEIERTILTAIQDEGVTEISGILRVERKHQDHCTHVKSTLSRVREAAQQIPDDLQQLIAGEIYLA